MKKKLIIILSIIAAIVLIGFITLKIMTKNAERNVETEKGIVVSASQLATAFSTQEDSANKKYLNKTLEITGIVSAVEKDSEGKDMIILKSASDAMGINCTFKNPAGSISVGDNITLKGICTGALSNILLGDCIFLHKNEQTVFQKDTTIYPPLSSLKDTVAVNIKKDTIKVNTIKTFSTSKAQILFDAGGGVEDIKATNSQAEASITSEGAVKFKVAILGFKFSDALMQEHFNDSYLESKKYPTASFHGVISNMKDIDLNKDGTYKAAVTGELTMHGVTQKINTPATLTVTNGKLKAQSSLNIKVDDYKISNDATSSAVLTITANF